MGLEPHELTQEYLEEHGVGESADYAQCGQSCVEQVEKRYKSLSLIRGRFVVEVVVVVDEV